MRLDLQAKLFLALSGPLSLIGCVPGLEAESKIFLTGVFVLVPKSPLLTSNSGSGLFPFGETGSIQLLRPDPSQNESKNV
jgi:hypothetical protein